MTSNQPVLGWQGEQVALPAMPPASLWARAAGLIGQATIVAAVVVAPWVFGSVEARAQVWLFGAVLVALACGVLFLLGSRSKGGYLPAALLPLVAAVGLGAFQLVPFGRDVRVLLSPAAVACTDSLLDAAGSADEAWAVELGVPVENGRRPLSLYPASTRHDLALLILAISMFFLGAIFFTQPGAHLWLCGLIVANGAAIAFFGLAQKLTWNGLIYWTIPLTRGGGPFGPFVNRNNAGGYLVLCLAGGIGATTWCFWRYLSVRDIHGTIGIGGRQDRFGLVKRRLVRMLGNLNARTLAAFSVTGLVGAGILCTLSRGATIAMTGAAVIAITAVVLSQRQHLSIGWPAAAVATGLALVCWVGMSDLVQARLATLFDDDIHAHARIPHWQDGMQAAGDFWQAGSGLGTYRYTYPQYQHSLFSHWFYYAENQYLETLVEGGIVGLGLLLAALGLVARSAWRLLLYAADARSVAFAVAGVFALAGQMIASVFDFGLRIPANMLLFALLCGALSGSAVAVMAGNRASIPRRSTRPVAVILAVCLFLGSLWGVMEIRAASVVETALRAVHPRGPVADASVPALVVHIEQLTAAVEHQNDSAEAHRRLAELWIQLYRAQALEELLAKTAFDADDPQLAQLTLPLVLHQQAHLYARAKMPTELDRLRAGPAVKNLISALKHLVLARNSCPLPAEIHCGIAQLCVLVTDPVQDHVHVMRTQRLAPGDPDLLFLCGLLDFHAGRFGSAQDNWKKSLSLTPRYMDDVWEIAGGWLTTPEAIERLLPDSPGLLVELARQRCTSEELRDLRLRLVERANELVEHVDLPEAERFYLRGSIRVLQEAYPEAIEDYARAVQLRPDAVEWRYEFALLLRQQGDLEEARQQAKLCARLAPRVRKHRKLLEEIHQARFMDQEGANDR